MRGFGHTAGRPSASSHHGTTTPVVQAQTFFSKSSSYCGTLHAFVFGNQNNRCWLFVFGWVWGGNRHAGRRSPDTSCWDAEGSDVTFAEDIDHCVTTTFWYKALGFLCKTFQVASVLSVLVVSVFGYRDCHLYVNARGHVATSLDQAIES